MVKYPYSVSAYFTLQFTYLSIMELSIYVVKVRVRETGVRQRRVLPQGAAVLLPPSMLSSLPVGVRALYCVKFLSVVPCILSIFAYLNCLFIYSLKFLCAILWCHFLRRLLLHCLQIRHRPTRASRLRCRSSSQVILAARVLTQVSPLPPSSALGCCCCWYLTWLCLLRSQYKMFLPPFQSQSH